MFQAIATFIIAMFKGAAHGAQASANVLALANAASTGLLAEQLEDFNLDEDAIKAVSAKSDLLLGITAKEPK